MGKGFLGARLLSEWLRCFRNNLCLGREGDFLCEILFPFAWMGVVADFLSPGMIFGVFFALGINLVGELIEWRRVGLTYFICEWLFVPGN